VLPKINQSVTPRRDSSQVEKKDPLRASVNKFGPLGEAGRALTTPYGLKNVNSSVHV
jgi:hypothetical protein